jgi:hypothetical protein
MYNGDKEACSDCYLQYGAAMQESEYGRHKVPEDDFEDLLSMCSVDPDDYPFTYTSIPPTTTGGGATTSASPPSSSPTCAGEMYETKEGETCVSIALANSMSTDRLIDVNHLDVNCTTLTSGMRLCIQDTCKLATIKAGQTCSDFISGTGFSAVQFISWNP